MPHPAPNPVPEDMNTLTTSLFFNGDCKDAIEFYKKVFNAKQVGQVVPTPDGKGIWHAMMQIGDTKIMLADDWQGGWEKGPTNYASAGFYAYVNDCDTWYDRAVEAGCEVIEPMADQFWGDRMGKLKDPFGHTWGIATHKWIYTPEEMAAQQGN